MILGAQKIRKFKILENGTWKEGPASYPLSVDPSLGPIF